MATSKAKGKRRTKKSVRVRIIRESEVRKLKAHCKRADWVILKLTEQLQEHPKVIGDNLDIPCGCQECREDAQ